jgi:hypothetical protein
LPTGFTLKALIIAIVGIGTLIIAYLMVVPRPCDGILKQTAPKLSVSMDFIKAKGEWLIGQEKIQDIGENAHQVGELLTTCCISQHSGRMTAEQFQVCINSAKDFETKTIQVANAIFEAQSAKEHGDTSVPDQKVKEAITATDAAANIVRDLKNVVPKPPPVLPAGKANVAITTIDGNKTIVRADSLNSSDYKEITLTDGQSIPFARIQNFDVLTKDGKVHLKIILGDGTKLEGNTDQWRLAGENAVGHFETRLENVKHVEFHRE